MSRASWQVLRTELLRGTAPVAAIFVLVMGALAMYSAASGWSAWPGRWMPFAASVRFSLFVVEPLAVAVGAWQAGRERRRRVGDQLASAARPAWQPLMLSWASVTLGCWLGLFVVVAAGAALVAPVATYAGGGWWVVLAVVFPGVAAMSALGVALGRIVPSRLTAPVAAIATYAAMIYAIDDAGRLGGVEWLTPVLSTYDGPGHMVRSTASLHQTLWFVGLAATVLIVVGARRRWLAVVPAAVAVAGAVPLLSTPGSIWEPDPAATVLVCAEGAPEVCLSRDNAFLLDDVVGPARQALSRFDGVPGGPTRAVPGVWYADHQPAHGDLVLNLNAGPTLTGGLAEEDWAPLVSWNHELTCDGPVTERHYQVARVAVLWVEGVPREWTEPEEAEALAAILSLPMADRKAWIGRYIEASNSCDLGALAELVAELR